VNSLALWLRWHDIHLSGASIPELSDCPNCR
jgi:hypothetical protein